MLKGFDQKTRKSPNRYREPSLPCVLGARDITCLPLLRVKAVEGQRQYKAKRLYDIVDGLFETCSHMRMPGVRRARRKQRLPRIHVMQPA